MSSGASFKNLTRMSAAGIPTISLVFGPSKADGAYTPNMSGYVVMVSQADQLRVELRRAAPHVDGRRVLRRE